MNTVNQNGVNKAFSSNVKSTVPDPISNRKKKKQTTCQLWNAKYQSLTNSGNTTEAEKWNPSKRRSKC